MNCRTGTVQSVLLGIILGFILPNLSMGQRTHVLSAREIAQNSLPSTVSITAKKSSGAVSGSGFFVRSDVIATSYHVIEGSSEAVVKIYGQNRKYVVSGIVAGSKEHDLVLLRVVGVLGKPLKLNQNDAAGIGDQVFVVSNPAGLEGTFSEGIVSSIRNLSNTRLLQITAPISHGSSGGAVLNQLGEVIGVAQGAIERGQSLNFAIPVFFLRQLNGSKSTPTLESLQYMIARRPLGFSFQANPGIQESLDFYRESGRTDMEAGLHRSGMYMSMARRIFRDEGLPENMAWVGQVLSGWRPNESLWFNRTDITIPQRFGLEINDFVDERNNLEESTRASARYLKFLADRYDGNWELALSAYVVGEAAIDQAIRKVGKADFWTLKKVLPKEARAFVPNVLATILIANNPDEYGFGHLRPAPSLKYDRVRLPPSTNLSVVANAANTTVEHLRYLNPQFRGNVTPPKPYVLNVPSGKANVVVDFFLRKQTIPVP